jgi:hypothetical protein
MLVETELNLLVGTEYILENLLQYYSMRAYSIWMRLS